MKVSPRLRSRNNAMDAVVPEPERIAAIGRHIAGIQ